MRRDDIYTLECCRCKAKVTLNGDQLADYERESRVVLCTSCEDDDEGE